MPEKKKSFIESGPVSMDKLDKNDGQGSSEIDQFIGKIEGNAPGTAGGRPKTNQAEISQTHDALLDDLESSMDRSMQELDDRYDEKFSELDKNIEKDRPVHISDEDRAQKMQARLMECGAAVEMLKTRLEQSEQDVKQHCEEEIEFLQKQLAMAREKIRGLEQAGGRKEPRSVKETLYNVMSDVSQALKNLVIRLKESKEAHY